MQFGRVLECHLAFLFYLASGKIIALDVLLLKEFLILIVVYAVNDFRLKGESATTYVSDVVLFGFDRLTGNLNLTLYLMSDGSVEQVVKRGNVFLIVLFIEVFDKLLLGLFHKRIVGIDDKFGRSLQSVVFKPTSDVVANLEVARRINCDKVMSV